MFHNVGHGQLHTLTSSIVMSSSQFSWVGFDTTTTWDWIFECNTTLTFKRSKHKPSIQKCLELLIISWSLKSHCFRNQDVYQQNTLIFHRTVSLMGNPTYLYNETVHLLFGKCTISLPREVATNQDKWYVSVPLSNNLRIRCLYVLSSSNHSLFDQN